MILNFKTLNQELKQNLSIVADIYKEDTYVHSSLPVQLETYLTRNKTEQSNN